MLLRTGLFTAVAIAIHNFPEGLATFGTTLSNIKLGIIIAVAIALHNIPEGISVSVPIFYATGSKKKAFYYSFLSGLAEPVGAIIGFLIIYPFLSAALITAMLAFVAGIMVYISIDELLPMAHKYGHSHTVIFGVILGMFVMAISLILL
jgi:ZIP family zinc transporter